MNKALTVPIYGSLNAKILKYATATVVIACFGLNAQETTGIAAKIYQQASPSVFVISVRDEGGQPVSFGTGFLVGGRTLATNLHVVEGTHVFVEEGPVQIPATLDKRDPANDLAIVKVSVDISAAPLQLSRKRIFPGENIFVIGNPEGLDKSISAGIVAANREIDGRQLLQITAPISHGSSGGPVLDSIGEVIGVTVAMLKDGQNLNFAVPVAKLIELLSESASTPSATTAIEESPYDFRQIRWGMSMTEVMAVEGTPDDSDANRLYFAPRSVGAHKVSIIYAFNGDKLAVVLITLLENSRHENEYNKALKDWAMLLTQKYGLGRKSIDTAEKWAVSASLEWTTPRSEIALLSDWKTKGWGGTRSKLRICASDPKYLAAYLNERTQGF